VIEVAFTGRAGKPPETRATAQGAPWKSLSLAVDSGSEGPAEWISVAAFGDVAAELPDDMVPGERVYVEGKLRLSRWQTKGGEQRATLQVNATRVLVLDRIGRRRKPSRVRRAGADSQAPLSGCERGQPSDELTTGEVPR
jgi:single-stranded DNA-binding protein